MTAVGLVAALGATYLTTQLFDRPYRSTATLASALGAYYLTRNSTFEKDVKCVSEKVSALSDHFKRSLVVALTTPLVLSTLTWKSIAYSFASFLTSVGIIPLSIYASIAAALACVGRVITGLADEVCDLLPSQPPVMVAQSPDEPEAITPKSSITSIVTLIFSGFCMAYGITASKPKCLTQWIESICRNVTWNGTKYQSMSTFFSAVINFLKDLVDWGMAKISRSDVLTRLSTNHPEIIDAWLCEVDILTHPSYEEKIFSSPEWMKRVFQATELGDLVFRDVMKERPVRCPIPGLLKRYGDLKRLRDRAVSWSTSVSIRQEPYCVWVFGDSGVGKSQASNYIGYAICRGTDCEVLGNPIYDIQPGTSFWTGCQGKRIARFDDFSILRGERGVDDLSNFMRLKSPAIFIAEQAEIEDKGKPWSPVGVVVNSNIGFPTPMELCTPEAFFRRRDVLYKARYIDELDSVKNLPFDDTRVQDAIKAYRGDREATPFDWLRFDKYQNPCNAQSSIECSYTFDDMIKDVEENARGYRQKQHNLYIRALEEITNLQPESVVDYPLSECLETIREGSKSFFCTLIDPLTKFDITQWCKDLTHLGVEATTASVEDVSSATDEISEVANIPLVGQIGDYIEPKDEHTGKLTLLRQSTSWLTDTIHRTSILCHCNNDYSKVRWNNHCVHYKRMSLFEAQSAMWRRLPDKFQSVDRSIEIPLVCGADCIFNERGISQCLKEANSWVTTGSQTDWINYEKEEVDLSDNPKYKNYIDFLKTKVGVALNAIYLVLKSAYTYIIAALCLGGYFVYKYIKGKPKPVPKAKEIVPVTGAIVHTIKRFVDPEKEAQIVKSSDPGSSKLHRVIRGVASKQFGKPSSQKTEMQSQAAADMCAILRSNIVWIQPENTGTPWRCYGLCEFYVLTLNHYWIDMERNHTPSNNLYVYRQSKQGLVTKIMISVDSVEHYVLPDTEYRVIKLPPHCTTMFKDIRHHFGSQTQFERSYYPRSGTIYCQRLDIEEIVPLSFEYPIMPQDVVTKDGIISSTVSRPIRYAWSAPGRCMSAILGVIGGQQIIIGFHVAGAKHPVMQLGVGEPLFSEDFFYLSNNALPRDIEELDKVNLEAQAAISIKSNVIPISVLDEHYAQARKSRIIPSHIGQVLEEKPVTVPAPLCRNDVPGKAFDPMEEGVAFHGEPTIPCHPSLYSRAHEDYTEMVLDNCTPVMGARQLTIEEAVCGIPEVSIKSMVLSTSEGYPYIFKRPLTAECNKKWLIEREQVDGRMRLTKVHDLVTQAMNHKHDLRCRGVLPVTIFADCLKDARIPLYKLSKPGATRVFSVSPIDFTIHFRMYFGAFLAAYKHNRLNLEHAVGINVQSIEWTLLAQKLAGDGFTKFLDGDFSKFGPRLDPQDSLDFCETINEWYLKNYDTKSERKEDVEQANRIRTIMILEACQSKHLCRNLVYQTLVGMPSGFPGTVEWNNASNAKGIRRAWLDCWQDDPTMCNMAAFHENVRLYTYGDDIVVGISDLAATRFNNIFLADFYGRHGMKYTSATKGDVNLPYVSLSELSFLKHKWVPHPKRANIYAASIDETSIHECYKWIHDDGTITSEADLLEPTLVNCEMALYLAYGHGPQFYNTLRATFKKWFAKARLVNPGIRRPSFYTWDELDNIIWPSEPTEITTRELDAYLEKYETYIGDRTLTQIEY